MFTLDQVLGDDASHLQAIDEHTRLAASARDDFLRLHQAAADAGFALSVASGHRDFSRQLAIWNDKFNGKRPVLDDHDKVLDLSSLNEQQKIQAIMRFSALPGASRHHWGSDFDYYDATALHRPLQLIPAEYLSGGPLHPLFHWLRDHAALYGFHFPYARDRGGVAPEPWHLSHTRSAMEASRLLTSEVLATRLAATDIAGKSTLLAQLPELMVRYVTNVEASR